MPLRECVGDQIQILAKTAAGDLVMVNPSEFADGKSAGTLSPLDATEAVMIYVREDKIPVYNLDGQVLHTAQGLKGVVAAASFDFPRINLVNQLVDSTHEFGFPAIEPLRGAPPADFVYPDDYISGVADRPADEGKF